MPNTQNSYRLPVIVAAVAHLVLIALLFVSFHKTHFRWNSQQKAAVKPIVKATTVDTQQVAQQVEKIRAEQMKKQQAEKQRLKAIEHKALLATQKRRREEQRLHALKIAQQKLKQQQLAEKHAAQQKALQQRKKLAAKQQSLQQQLLKEQLAKEQQQLLTQQKQLQIAQQQGYIDKYRAQILQAIQNNWHPSQQNPKLLCLMIVHLAPGGVVTAVDIARSSGDEALDSSAQTAIYKSSPLPVPKDPALFDAFRSLRIKMSPQEIQ